MSSKDVNQKELVNQKINEQDVSVYAYDKAIVEDFRARFKKSIVDSEVNPNVQIGSPDQMFNIIGQLDNDNVIMPFIGLQRLDWQLNLDRQGFQTFIGDRVYQRIGPDDKPINVRAQVIPITINYRLSVWSKDRVTNDALVRELLFYYHLKNQYNKYLIQD